MRRLACGLLFLLIAAPASAKEIARASVCGADRCVRIAPDMDLFPATVAEAPATGAGYVRLKLLLEPEDFTVKMDLVGDLARGEDGAWMRMAPSAMPRIRRAARRVEPRQIAELDLAAPVATAPPAARAPAAPAGDGGGSPVPFVAAALFALLAAAVIVRRRAAT